MDKRRFYIISSTLLLIGLFAGVIQYVGMFDALYAAANNPGHLWSEMECNNTFCIKTESKKIGVGTMTPQTTLDVNGSVKIEGESSICDSSNEGSMSYFSGNFHVCQGNVWQDFIEEECGDITDPRDNNIYSTIKIGYQCWMAENLKYLPSVNSFLDSSESVPYYYVYGYNGTDVSTAKAKLNYNTYGVLYNWSAATTACPSGWKLPTHDDWTTLERSVCTSGTCKADFPYDVYTGGQRGTNEGEVLRTGDFNVLMSGMRYPGVFKDIDKNTIFWTSTVIGNYPWYRLITNDNNKIDRSAFFIDVDNSIHGKDMGYPIRCIKK